MSGKAQPHMALVGREITAINYLKKIIEDIFGSAVKVTSYLMPEDVSDTKQLLKRKIDRTIPVVLTSHNGFYNDAKVIFPHSVVVGGEKVLTGLNLEKLILLPLGKKVLVVNQPRLIALETIENLIELGLDHLSYIPFVKGDPCPDDVDTAVCAGLLHHCPQHIANKIDVGYRVFSIDTLSKLITALDLDTHYLDKLTAQFHLPLILSSSKLAENLEKVRLLDKERELFINKVPDAILAASAEKMVLSMNRPMEALLGQAAHLVVGSKVTEIIGPISNGRQLAFDLGDNIAAKIWLKGEEYLYTLTTMHAGHNTKYIFTFKKPPTPEQNKDSAYQGSYYRQGYVAKYRFDDFWGSSPKILELKAKAFLFAKNNMNVLIYGESGTGKEILAQAIHSSSARKDKPFLAVNFAALTENLIESELFGYDSGAFTGARKEGKSGYFEMASGGTLFLDEIGSAPLSLQPKLLRVLQEREVMRVGGHKMIPIDVRIIAATNTNIKKQVENNLFRPDLYYRLNVLSLKTIALREFKDNIKEMLSKHLASKYSFCTDLSDGQLEQVLLAYDWPGNVRELFNVADYMYYSSQGKSKMTVKNIPEYILEDVEEKIKPGLDALQKRPGKLKENELWLAILQIYAQNPERICGRRQLLQELGKRSLPISEHYLKMHLQALKEQGLICSGMTRQGTALTEKGYSYLQINTSK